MWPGLVVMATPSCQTFPCLAQRVEPLHIQAFVSQPSIETFNEPVLYRAAGAVEAKLHTMPDGPDLERAAGELAAVIQSDALGSCAAFLYGPRQGRSYMRSVHRSVGFQRYTLASELIDNRQDAVGAAIRQLVADEIGRPALVRRRRETLRNSLAVG